jgi:hypothetical protein
MIPPRLQSPEDDGRNQLKRTRGDPSRRAQYPDHTDAGEARHLGSGQPIHPDPKGPVMETPVTVEEWRAHEAELRQRTTELDTEYAGQKMPDEARSEWDDTNAQIEAARETIAELEVRAAAHR